VNKNSKICNITIDEEFSIRDTVFNLKGKDIGLYISSSDENFIYALIKGLEKIKIFNFSSNKTMLVNGKKIVWKIKSVEIIPEEKVENNEVLFKTNSPILLENDKKPILFNESIFEDVLNENIKQRFLKILNRKPKEKVKFEPLEMGKVVVKHTLKSFREKTKKPIMYLTGSAGKFKLTGDSEDLQIIYQTGLGLRTNQGFGMVNVLV
jgi:CRISPR-associated endoribonuclease Cas6